MAIFFDNFDGGDSGEGFWNPATAASTVSGGDPGNCLRITPATEFNRETNVYSQVSLFFGLKISNTNSVVTIIDLRNDIPLTYSGVAVVQVAIENDHSISVYTGGTLIANTGVAAWGNFILDPDTWYFFQLNVALQSVVVLGVPKVEVTTGLAVNGSVLFSGEVKTVLTTASLPTAAAEINLWRFRTGDAYFFYDNITAETIVAFNTYPNPGAPLGRLTQGVIEVIEAPDDAAARMSQGVIEIPELPDNSNARVTQMVIELIGNFTYLNVGGWRVYEA